MFQVTSMSFIDALSPQPVSGCCRKCQYIFTEEKECKCSPKRNCHCENLTRSLLKLKLSSNRSFVYMVGSPKLCVHKFAIIDCFRHVTKLAVQSSKYTQHRAIYAQGTKDKGHIIKNKPWTIRLVSWFPFFFLVRVALLSWFLYINKLLNANAELTNCECWYIHKNLHFSS